MAKNCQIGHCVRGSGARHQSGVFAARALTRDSLGQPMPVWQGCLGLASAELFLLAENQQSFDSRCFGMVSASDVVGRAVASRRRNWTPTL